VLLRRYGFHLTSLVSIVVFMLLGYSATLSVVYASAVGAVLSWIRPETAMTLRRLVEALREGAVQVLNVAATCAAAGIIVGVVTLTGLGLKFSEIGARPAGEKIWDMYLSPFAAAAITGAGPYETTMQAWKYTLPAFVLPFVFVTDPIGTGLLLQLQPGMDWFDVVWVTLLSTLGLALLAAAFQGFGLRRMGGAERAGLALAGLLLVFPAPLEALSEWALQRDLPSPHWSGLVLGGLLLAWQAMGRARSRA